MNAISAVVILAGVLFSALRLLALLALVGALFMVMPARAQAPTGIPTFNASVSITAGNTFQTILANLPPPTGARKSLTIQNNNATDSCWIYIGSATAAKGTSILLLPGGSYTRYFPFVPSDAIQATCTTTADTLYVDTQ